MLSTILWIIGGFILLAILVGIIKIFLLVLGVKKMIGIVKQEVEHLPNDLNTVRKEVQNENSTMTSRATGTAKTVARVGWRWFRSM